MKRKRYESEKEILKGKKAVGRSELKKYLNKINILAYKRMPFNVKIGWFFNEIFKRPGYIVYRIKTYLDMAKNTRNFAGNAITDNQQAGKRFFLNRNRCRQEFIG